MKLYLTIGVGILLVTAVVSTFMRSLEVFVYISATVGFCFFIVGLMFTGVFLPSDRIRETNRWEPADETKRRFRLAILCMGIGLPNLIVAMLVNYIVLQ